MRLVIIGDTHFGCRNDHAALQSHFETFYRETFFPAVEEYKPDMIVHLGDLVDRRKYINFNTAAQMRSCFLAPLTAYCYQNRIRTIILAGNHDTYYKDTNSINALNEVHLDNKVFLTVQDAPFVHKNMAFMPWICEQNQEVSLKFIQDTRAKLLFGHFEILGGEMHKGEKCDHGMGTELFKKFDRVYSGHFHHKSTMGENIEYLGAPYQMTWNDYDSTKGFHFLDTETLKLTFVPNPRSIYHKLVYDDSQAKTIEELNASWYPYDYSNAFIKIIVTERGNPFWFDTVIDRLEKAGPADLKVVDEDFQLEFGSDEDIGTSVDDPITILKNHCKSEKHPRLVEDKLTDLYNRALIGAKV